MSDEKLTDQEEIVLWRRARDFLMEKKLKSTVSSRLVGRLRAQLPAKEKDETIGELIRRSSARASGSGEVVAFKPKPKRLFKPLTEFVRLAADTSDAEIPLPGPESPLESADGRFRLSITVENQSIDIFIQALGFAADEFANCRIGLANPNDDNEPIAVVTLDSDGDGRCQMDDTPGARRALLRPVILLMD